VGGHFETNDFGTYLVHSMNADYQSYSLNESYSTEAYCKLYKHFPYFFLGHSGSNVHELPPAYCDYEKIIAGGYRKMNLDASKGFFVSLEEERNKNPDWCFGYISYDIKNQLEHLHSENPDYLGLEEGGFFFPAFIFLEKEGKTTLLWKEKECSKEKLFSILMDEKSPEGSVLVKVEELCPKAAYLQAIEKIKQKIIHGDIYEINFCRAWLGTYEQLDAEHVFLALTSLSNAPFASLFKMDFLTVIGASPERFLRKDGTKLLSQPIKGTRKRSKEKILDNVLKQELGNSEKEKAENIMIVDLVRNDLSKYAAKGSVKVEELCGLYSFEQVHQMISSVSAELRQEADAIKAMAGAFPMGSMTGAPKISAMSIIEEMENFKRGIYSGSIGYFSSDGQFDFNVVIRSIVLNTKTKKLLFAAGGAITHLSDPEQEFEESTLKARALAQVLGHQL
jgi:para-aminobenzoate synthetase component 1